VWGELGNHSKAHLKTEADASDPPAEDAEDVDAVMKSDKKVSHCELKEPMVLFRPFF